MKPLFAAALFLNLSVASAADLAGKDLLNYFSSTCPSQGDWTKLVMSDSEALISILHNLKTDSDCVSAAGAIAQLGGLASKITQLQTTSVRKIELEKLKASEFELTSQLSVQTDPLIIQDLQSAVRQLQIDKAVLLAEESANKKYAGEDIITTYSQIVLATNQFHKSIGNNAKCLDKNPRIISSVTSLVSSIGGAMTAVNPALGIGLSAGSEILGQTVEAIRINRINNQIGRIAEGTLINSGFKCALESLSNRWCEVSDARKLLDFKFKLKKDPVREGGLLSVISLYDRKIPAFLDWLGKVRAGAPASTESDANRHEVVQERFKMVQVAKSKGDGILTEFKSRYYDPTTVTNEDKWNIIRQVINKLTVSPSRGGFSSSNSVTSPLDDIYNSSYAPFRLLGLAKTPTQGGLPASFNQFDPLTEWPAELGTFIPDYEKLVSEYNLWIEKSTTLVSREFTQVLQPDSLGVLSRAFERTGSKWKVSPKQSIDEIIVFLETNRPTPFEISPFQKIYTDTVEKLKIISAALTDHLILGTVSETRAIEIIFSTAKLQFGTVLFESRIEMAVRISLDEYFQNAKPEEQNIAAQMMAMESYLETLRKVTGKDSDELVMLDIQNAQTGALNNMTNFVNVFGKNINQLLKMNQKRIQGTTDSSLKAIYNEDQDKICVLLTSMPALDDKIDFRDCKGRQLKSFIKDGPVSPLISDAYMQTDFSERNCAYRDHIRKSKIYREWDIKLE